MTSPPFVGDDYFCESGLNVPWTGENTTLHTDDPLWDGKNCPGNTCCELNNPPWFYKSLPNLTTDNIEIRVCSWDVRRSRTPIELIELYIK